MAMAEKSKGPISRTPGAPARQLRYAMTAAEEILWTRLRNCTHCGWFRRQRPTGLFVAGRNWAGFSCPEERLVLGLDSKADAHVLCPNNLCGRRIGRRAARCKWPTRRSLGPSQPMQSPGVWCASGILHPHGSGRASNVSSGCRKPPIEGPSPICVTWAPGRAPDCGRNEPSRHLDWIPS